MNRRSSVKWEEIQDYLLIPCPGCDPRGECNVLLEYKGTYSKWLGPSPSLLIRIKDFLLGEEHVFWCPRCEVVRNLQEIKWEHEGQILEAIERFDEKNK
jgi:phage FluMu protein Com